MYSKLTAVGYFLQENVNTQPLKKVTTKITDVEQAVEVENLLH